MIDPTFWTRLKMFIEKIEVSDLPGEEEKEMITRVCDTELGKIAKIKDNINTKWKWKEITPLNESKT